MSLSIGMAGMDPATETALKAAFLEANQRLGDRWQLLPETQADHIVVDMDSMYGPMSWLRLHAAGKRVVGLTSASRAQTDFRLGRPFSTDSMTALLQQIAEQADAPAQSSDAAPVVDAAPPAAAAEPVSPEAEAPSSATTVHAAEGSDVAPDAATAPAEPTPPPAPESAAEPAPAPAVEAADRSLLGRLRSGSLKGKVRYRRPSGPTLLIDAEARNYHGPAALKPLLPYFEGEVADEALEPLDADTFAREAAAVGPAQPLTRLVWLGALARGGGRLLPGYDPEARYRLNRWPQTEREFPRHFRIATAMMKAPATLAEVAAASGIALEEIADFVNANLATGVAEAVVEAPPEPVAPPRSGGLLGRLRGR